MYLMGFQETAAEQELRTELRAYFAQLRDELGIDRRGAPGEDSAGFRAAIRRLGQDGWLGIGWPKDVGGQGRSARDQFIMFDDELVHLETISAEVNVTQPREIALYTEAFAALADQSLTGTAARALITTALDHWRDHAEQND